jgi:hypothetical protein
MPPIIIQPHAPTVFPQYREPTINPVKEHTPLIASTATTSTNTSSIQNTPSLVSSPSIHHSDIYNTPPSTKYYNRFDYIEPKYEIKQEPSSRSQSSFINNPSTVSKPIYDIDDDSISNISSFDSTNDHIIDKPSMREFGTSTEVPVERVMREFGTNTNNPIMRDAQTYVRVNGQQNLVGHTPKKGRPTREKQQQLHENDMNDVYLTPTLNRHRTDDSNVQFDSNFIVSPDREHFVL